jgi:hypothetical protein
MSGEPKIKRAKVSVTARKSAKPSAKPEKPAMKEQDVLPLDAAEFLEAFDELSSSSDSEEEENGIPLESIPAPPKPKTLSAEESKLAAKDNGPWVLYIGYVLTIHLVESC